MPTPERAPRATTQPRARTQDALPRSLPPRGLTREQAAAYVCVGPTKFDQLVRDGRMPRPKRIDGLNVWDVRALDKAFDALPDSAGNRADATPTDPWNHVEA